MTKKRIGSFVDGVSNTGKVHVRLSRQRETPACKPSEDTPGAFFRLKHRHTFVYKDQVCCLFVVFFCMRAVFLSVIIAPSFSLQVAFDLTAVTSGRTEAEACARTSYTYEIELEWRGQDVCAHTIGDTCRCFERFLTKVNDVVHMVSLLRE